MDKPHCPVIETEQEAIAIGKALAKVLHYDERWALNVFNSALQITWKVGPGVLNEELRSMWDDYLVDDERERILAEYVAVRLTGGV